MHIHCTYLFNNYCYNKDGDHSCAYLFSGHSDGGHHMIANSLKNYSVLWPEIVIVRVTNTTLMGNTTWQQTQ